MLSPRRAQPGPGNWLVTDTDSRLSLSGGRLVFGTAAATGWDRCGIVAAQPFSRRRGQYVEYEFTHADAFNRIALGWANAASPARSAWEIGAYFDTFQNLNVMDGGDTDDVINVLQQYTTTSYKVRVVDGGPPRFDRVDTGGDFFVYVRPSAESTWRLLWRKPAGPAYLTQLYPFVACQNKTGFLNYARVRYARMPRLGAALQLPSAGELVCAGAEGIVECVFAAPASGTAGVQFRRTDADNLWKLVADRTNSRLDLIKREAGVETTVDSLPVTWNSDKIYTLTAVLIGTRITTFLGRRLHTVTADLFNQTAPVSGVLASSAEYQYLRFDRGGVDLEG